MSYFRKLILMLTLVFAASLSNAEPGNTKTTDAELQEAIKIYHQLLKQGADGGQLFKEFTSQFLQPPGQGGQCSGSWDCEWPASSCENGWCVKPGGNGEGGQCSGSWDCEWPASSCENGWCVKPGGNGEGGQCSGSWDCEWPASRCENGWCVRP